MVKLFSAVILLFLLVPVDFSFAQAESGGVKIYSGYLHQYGLKSKTPFWRVFFSSAFPKREEVIHDRQCSIEFKSPVPFSDQTVTEVPKELTYVVRFNNLKGPAQENPVKEKDAFKKFVIKIYSNDAQEYSIDSDAEGKQLGLYATHHIFDPYLIYLILGQGIDHLEVFGAPGNGQDKYVLDKFEIHNNH